MLCRGKKWRQRNRRKLLSLFSPPLTTVLRELFPVGQGHKAADLTIGDSLGQGPTKAPVNGARPQSPRKQTLDRLAITRIFETPLTLAAEFPEQQIIGHREASATEALNDR
jgi:hypothetical protein